MRLWTAIAAVAACCALAPAAGAASLPERCESWFGADALAVICDPAGGSGPGLAIEIPGEIARGEGDLGIAQLVGREPFQDGERIVFTLAGASPATVVAFRAAAGDGVQSVVVEPFDPPARHYEVEIEGELARVTSDTGQVRTLTIDPPPPTPPRDGTPAEAVRSFVSLMQSDLEGACGLLSRTARTSLGADGECPRMLDFVLFDEEVDTYPDLVSIRARRVRVKHGRPTIAEVRLVYRFDPEEPYEAPVERVWATVALARESGGWRIALPTALSPRNAATGASHLSRSEVLKGLKRLRQGARKVRAQARRRRQASRAVRPGPTACPGPVRTASDPERDVLLNDGRAVARRQDEAGVDLIGGSQSRVGRSVCFELRFRTPVPEELVLDLWLWQRAPIRQRVILSGAVTVAITGNTAVATRDLFAERFFAPTAAVSPGRDAISVVIRDSRGWPMIAPDVPDRWAAEAAAVAPAIDNWYVDQLPLQP